MNGSKGVVALVLATGCGDVTGSNGELGRLGYRLWTDYEAEQEELTELPLMTGYTQLVDVSLTPRGYDVAKGHADRIVHRSDDAHVVSEDAGRGEPTDLSIGADAPGDVVIESMLEGELFDRIRLRFDDPTDLELVTWVREPWASEWSDGEGAPITRLQEGSQISFLAIPLAGPTRLGGEFTPTITVDPPSLAVPDAQPVLVQEDQMSTVNDPVTFFAVEPGVVTFTVREDVHGVEVVRQFEIVP